MFKSSVFALQEEEKRLEYNKRQSWLFEIHTLRDSLLRTAVVDAELCENQENRNDVMQSVLKFYVRHFPAHADSLRHVRHRVGERGQSLAGDNERNNACMGPRHRPSNSQV